MHCIDIRQRFIDYYQSLGFRLLPRAPMMHPSIPMSFVMSAGLVQVETSLANAKHRSGDKFVLVQDCFRHFDLQTIGADNIHLSLFEMPAAFMFGGNNRKTAITHIWTVATDVLGIDPQRLWVSYFGGDLVEGQEIPEDRETYQAWRAVGVPQQRLVGLGRKHNYWVQGGGIDNGYASEMKKGGPNTELFYDTGAKHACSLTCQPGCRCGRFIEFSNTLFVCSQIHPQTHAFAPMQEPFTEIVIGSERVAMILQDSPSVFDTQEYASVLKTIRQFIRAEDVAPKDIQESERVIADHLRALCVLVADGAPPPGKDGRERIMKLLVRAVLTRERILGIDSTSSYDFISSVIRQISETFFQETQEHAQRTEDVLLSYFKDERKRFLKTLERGKKQLKDFLKQNQGKPLSGWQIVTLEKKWGFPHVLIKTILQQKNIAFLETEFQHALFAWKNSAY